MHVYTYKPWSPNLEPQNLCMWLYFTQQCVYVFLAVAGDVNVTPDGSKQEQQQGLKQTMTSALPAC